MRWPFSHTPDTGAPRFTRRYGALLDGEKRLLTISPYPSTLVFLEECTSGSFYVQEVNYPNYPDSFFLEGVPSESYPEWTWTNERLFVRTPSEQVTDALRGQASLTTEKGKVVGRIMTTISASRDRVGTGVAFQETVYAMKAAQAKGFKDSGYDEQRLLEFPFVVQYADFANIDPKQAANDILFKSQMDEDQLAKTELLRLRYFNNAREAKTVEELTATLQRFYKDCYGAVI
ncbi:MAG TPA: hypothetical protein VMH91_01385 [Candidatus Paceibacterota bacterium]|nr:hypothetical protein [Candidatus Paceibacterota bacterium]